MGFFASIFIQSLSKDRVPFDIELALSKEVTTIYIAEAFPASCDTHILYGGNDGLVSPKISFFFSMSLYSSALLEDCSKIISFSKLL